MSGSERGPDIEEVEVPTTEDTRGGRVLRRDRELVIAYNLTDTELDPELFSIIESSIANRTMNVDSDVRVVPSDDDVRESLLRIGSIIRKATKQTVEPGDIQVLTGKEQLPQSDINTIHKIVEENIERFPIDKVDWREVPVEPGIIATPIIVSK